MERFKKIVEKHKRPVIVVDPKKDPMHGKRFDGVDRLEDIHCAHFGKCCCGMLEGVEHHHQYE
jgi:hypothetical protein